MNIIAVDDERGALSLLVKAIEEAIVNSNIYAFTNTNEAIESFKLRNYEIAFLDIQIRGGISGIQLAKQIKDVMPNINIIFVTGYSEYGYDAMKVRASGYLLKPVISEDIKEELNNLRNPVIINSNNKIRIQTFGNFEIFYNAEPILFERRRSKEILAYLVDIRGTGASYGEIAAILWEDGKYDRARQKSLYNYIHDIKVTLQKYNIEELFISNRKTMMINTNIFDCDYYSFLQGDVPTINSYTGRYMEAYSWAEFTCAYLDQKSKKDFDY